LKYVKGWLQMFDWSLLLVVVVVVVVLVVQLIRNTIKVKRDVQFGGSSCTGMFSLVVVAVHVGKRLSC